MAEIVTPNLMEASALLGGVSLETVADMCSAVKAIHSFGPRCASVNDYAFVSFCHLSCKRTTNIYCYPV